MHWVKHGILSLLLFSFCFQSFTAADEWIRCEKAAFYITIIKCNTRERTPAFVCFALLWNLKWTSAIFPIAMKFFCRSLMIQLGFAEPLSCVTRPGARTIKRLRDWICSMNWQEDPHDCSEVMNGNAAFSDGKKKKKSLQSSAVWSCTYLVLNEPANSISKLEGTLPISGVFVIQAWRVCPPRFRDVRHNFLVGVVLMMCGE